MKKLLIGVRRRVCRRRSSCAARTAADRGVSRAPVRYPFRSLGVCEQVAFAR